MNWEKYSFDNYLKNELIFWKSLRAVYTGEKTKDRVLMSLKERYTEDFIMKMAEKRYNNMTALIKLFKDEYLEKIINRVKRKTNVDLGKDLNLANIKQSTSVYTNPSWLPVVIVLIAITIAIIAESSDTNGQGEDDTLIVSVEVSGLQAVVDENKFLTCDEIENQSYSAWVTYLLMLKATNTTEYMLALMCAKCNNLRVLVETYNYNHALILPENYNWLMAFCYAARLEECEIPY